VHEEELNKQGSKQITDTCSVLHTKVTDVTLLGTTWKNPSVTLVEGKGKAVPVHRKKKYYNTPWKRVLFKKLTITQPVHQSPPFTESEASLPYSHGPGPLFPA
jgi:hypothetical protein